MNDKSLNLAPVSDMELLKKAAFYFALLRRVVPGNRLEDVCSGILVLIHELIVYLGKKNLINYGNNKK